MHDNIKSGADRKTTSHDTQRENARKKRKGIKRKEKKKKRREANKKSGVRGRREKSKLILYEPTQAFEFGKIRCLD